MGYKLIFVWEPLYWGKNLLNANAGMFAISSIHVTPEWAYQLVTNNKEMDIPFKATIGHEIAHKTGEMFFLTFPWRVRFNSWAREVHADFGGAQLMLNGKRNTMLNAMKFKMKFKDKNYEDSTHPSWKRRMYYVKNYDFTPELIRKIAEDTGYRGERFIEKTCNFYEDIILS